MNLEEVYTVYWKKIFRLCMGYVNNYDQAQDLAQETFIIAWQQLPKFRGEASIGTWIFRIASNHCLRQIERDKRYPKAYWPVDLKEEMRESLEPQIQKLYRFISELAETDRIIISLELEDIKQAEIASIVGLSEANVRVKIHRIKEKLSQKFKQDGR
jgi:RNA polymerase sigma-70 factor, ECF subfamily